MTPGVLSPVAVQAQPVKGGPVSHWLQALRIQAGAAPPLPDAAAAAGDAAPRAAARVATASPLRVPPQAAAGRSPAGGGVGSRKSGGGSPASAKTLPKDHPSLYKAHDGRPLSELTKKEVRIDCRSSPFHLVYAVALPMWIGVCNDTS